MFSASSRHRDLNMSATNILSTRRIANIDPNDAMILPYDTTPSRMEFSETADDNADVVAIAANRHDPTAVSEFIKFDQADAEHLHSIVCINRLISPA
jgi:hypothetical protein